MLGAAYEYLLREFAEASGKKAGEFVTPRHVVHLLVKILDPKPGESIVDPARGSGGMLVEAVSAVRESDGNPDTLRLFGQEVNLTTSAIAKMNLYLHGLTDFEVKRGDTFSEPRFLDGAKLRQFDMVLANPPFSLQNWGASEWTNDPYGRVICAVPPAKNGDYAWIQHMIASMREDTGRVGVVMPHGVLFRGGKEGQIRQCLLEKDLLEAVIGLPNNLFYSTSIPVSLLIWRKTKSTERHGKVLFVDASARFKPGKNQNTMTDEDVDTIYAAYSRTEDIDGPGGLHLRLVEMERLMRSLMDEPATLHELLRLGYLEPAVREERGVQIEGYRLSGFEDEQMSRDQRLAEREAARNRMRNVRASRKGSGVRANVRPNVPENILRTDRERSRRSSSASSSGSGRDSVVAVTDDLALDVAQGAARRRDGSALSVPGADPANRQQPIQDDNKHCDSGNRPPPRHALSGARPAATRQTSRVGWLG